jgi:hypothetical protein
MNHTATNQDASVTVTQGNVKEEVSTSNHVTVINSYTTMWEHIMKQAKPVKHPKSKSIDLGALQDALALAKRAYATDAKALEKSRDSYERSKKTFQEAHEALKAGSRAVLE